MKFMYIVSEGEGDTIRDKVDRWIGENEENILEIVGIEYNQKGTIYFAIVSYFERAQ